MYAGCVYWPFEGYTTLGTTLAAVIAGTAVLQTAWKLTRPPKPAAPDPGARGESSP